VNRVDRTTVALALLGVAILAWLGLGDFAFSDYDNEARPALDALLAGHLHRFLADSPAYGGSIALRAPLAFLVDLFGGGALAQFRAMAVPGLFLVAGLGVALASAAMRLRSSAPAAWLALALCVVNPIALKALQAGHAEELAAAALVVIAMLAARAERSGWSGLLVGLAVVSKPWAIVALPAVVAVLPAGRGRLLALGLGLGLPAAVLAPFVVTQIVDPSWSDGTKGDPITTGSIFKPWQIWWPLGTSTPLLGPDGLAIPGTHSAPGWLNRLTHPAIVASALAVTLLWAKRRRPADGLLLLAFVLLLRCLLDPWNNVYYALPCVLALAAHDATRGRAPIAAAALTAATWLTIVELPTVASPDVQFAVYMAWALPGAAGLGLRLYSPARWARLRAAVGDALGAAPLSPRSSVPSGTS
jgi:hypothetical protein